jgi:hypothetical protein
VEDCWKHGSENPYSATGTEFPGQLSDCHFVNNESSAWSWVAMECSGYLVDVCHSGHFLKRKSIHAKARQRCSLSAGCVFG